MSFSLVALIALFLLFAFFGWTVAQGERPAQTIFFKRRDYLLSRAERDFFRALKPLAERRNLLVFSKVRLEDVIRIAPHVRDKSAAWSRLRSQHIDFLLCTGKEIRPLLAIELDDMTRDAPWVTGTQAAKDECFAKADMPLLRIAAAPPYDLRRLEKLLAEKLD